MEHELALGVRRECGRRPQTTAQKVRSGRSDWAFGNLQYKLNRYVTFAFEQSLYSTIAIPNQTTGVSRFRRNTRAKRTIVGPEFVTILTF